MSEVGVGTFPSTLGYYAAMMNATAAVATTKEREVKTGSHKRGATL